VRLIGFVALKLPSGLSEKLSIGFAAHEWVGGFTIIIPGQEGGYR